MMKNMLLYRILDPAHIKLLNNWEALAEALAEVPASEPMGSQWRTLGFDKPAPTVSDELVWSGAGSVCLFSLYFNERQLPGSAIKDFVAERVRGIEEREMRKCYRKEIAQMRDDAVAALLPKAFIKHSTVDMLAMGDLLIVGASSAKKAEDCLSVLREALGALAVRPLTLKTPADSWLTDLMRENGRPPLALLDSAKLANGTKDAVTFKGIELSDAEPQNYINGDFSVTELALLFDETMTFKITSQLIFKGIKFADLINSQVADDAQGDPAALLDGSLLIFTNQVRRLVDTLVDQIGEDLPVRVETKQLAGDRQSIIEAVQAYLVNEISADRVVTVGLVQRRFQISTDMAAITLGALETMGVITEDDGLGNRDVIRTGMYTAPAVDDDEFDEPTTEAVDEDDDL